MAVSLDQLLPSADVFAPRLMIVDDDELARARLATLATAGGFTYSCAPDGAEALRILKNDPHSIVVTDRVMPGVDGLRLCQELRRGPYPIPLYILMLTIRDEDSESINGYVAGADTYLSKNAQDIEVLMSLCAARRRIQQEVRRACRASAG